MDKIGLFIIAFIVMFVLTASLLITGTVPVIFNTGIVVNETKFESQNQTRIMMDFVSLYLKNMDTDTKTAVSELVVADILAKKASEKQDMILNINQNITNQILNMSEEHKQITTKIDNITQLNYELLEKHTINSSLAEGKAEEAVNQSGR